MGCTQRVILGSPSNKQGEIRGQENRHHTQRLASSRLCLALHSPPRRTAQDQPANTWIGDKDHTWLAELLTSWPLNSTPPPVRRHSRLESANTNAHHHTWLAELSTSWPPNSTPLSVVGRHSRLLIEAADTNAHHNKATEVPDAHTRARARAPDRPVEPSAVREVPRGDERLDRDLQGPRDVVLVRLPPRRLELAVVAETGQNERLPDLRRRFGRSIDW